MAIKPCKVDAVVGTTDNRYNIFRDLIVGCVMYRFRSYIVVVVLLIIIVPVLIIIVPTLSLGPQRIPVTATPMPSCVLPQNVSQIIHSPILSSIPAYPQLSEILCQICSD